MHISGEILDAESALWDEMYCVAYTVAWGKKLSALLSPGADCCIVLDGERLTPESEASTLTRLWPASRKVRNNSWIRLTLPGFEPASIPDAGCARITRARETCQLDYDII